MSLPITVRQTRNHLATEVEYIASKTITLPDPCGKVQYATLSKLGFGTRVQKFWAISFRGSVAPGPWKSRTLSLVALREILVYDEEFGVPSLIVIDIDDIEAAEEWRRNCWKEQRRTARIARLKSLFTLPHSISTSKFPEDSASSFEASGKWNRNEIL